MHLWSDAYPNKAQLRLEVYQNTNAAREAVLAGVKVLERGWEEGKWVSATTTS